MCRYTYTQTNKHHAFSPLLPPQFDLHGEVTILEALARCEGVPSPRAGFVCRLFDYGCDTEGLYLVLKVCEWVRMCERLCVYYVYTMCVCVRECVCVCERECFPCTCFT